MTSPRNGPAWSSGATVPPDLVNTVDDATALLKDLLPELTGTLAIDCFIGNHPDDPTGELACAKAVELVQALIDSLLTFQAEFKCRVNIVTQNAVIDVCNPAHTSLWGLIRCMDKEIGTASEFTLSLIDIGACADLDTFAWLVGNDIREREIAIRGRSALGAAAGTFARPISPDRQRRRSERVSAVCGQCRADRGVADENL